MFSEVQGMTELNDGKSQKIRSAKPYSFTLEEDTTNFGTYVKGGIVSQVKQPKVLKFKPLREALKDPGDFLLSDFSKMLRSSHLLLLTSMSALEREKCKILTQNFSGALPLVPEQYLIPWLPCLGELWDKRLLKHVLENFILFFSSSILTRWSHFLLNLWTPMILNH
ncbi:hypothetical protein V6Z11_A13G271300 [Gossypium hirsutum]